MPPLALLPETMTICTKRRASAFKVLREPLLEA
jgi:hypothetical protein